MGRIAAARHEEHAQARRAAILDAALRVFAELGFSAARMEQVAAAAGVSKAALYLYFPSKDALLQAVLDRYALLPEMPAMVAALEQTPPALGIPKLISQAWPLLRQRRGLAQVIVHEIQSHPGRARLFAERVGLPAYQALAAYLERWMERGQLRRQHALAAAQCLFGMLWFFLLTQELTGGKELYPLSDQTVVSTVSRMFLEGATQPLQAAARPATAGSKRAGLNNRHS
ncbi:MAG TPA: TetR family transcriptional regulator [Candidatus Binataceae bacterium]|nr:TetR family transcriptional regulator [Candidatus Binataceae bacterium]